MSGLEQEIQVMQADGAVKSYLIHVRDFNISITFENGVVRTFKGQDLFSSLQLLREDFEKTGAKVLCNGARVDAYPSRMSRSMGGGRKIYLLTHGQQARRSDLVDIFGVAAPEKIGSVESQSRFYKEWINSLGD